MRKIVMLRVMIPVVGVRVAWQKHTVNEGWRGENEIGEVGIAQIT